jgi:undecaprenyl-diphosphatase
VHQNTTALDRWLLTHRQRALNLSLALANVVAICWIVIQTTGSFPGDAHFVSWIRHPHPPPLLASCAQVFGLLATPTTACLSVAVAWLVVDRYVGPRYGVLVIVAVGAVGLNSILKLIFGPTPLQLSTRGPTAGNNFPSGHVTYATCLFGILAWFALARGKRLTSLGLMGMIICMGPCRILDGAHWPSDVLAGYALGAAWTILVLVIGTPWAAAQSASAPVSGAQDPV